MDALGDDERGDVPAEEGDPVATTDGAVTPATSTATASVVEGTWIVGLDGSECATNALDWVTANVADRGTAITLVSAWQTPVVGAYPMSTTVTVPYDESELRDAAAHDLSLIHI